MAKEIRRSRNTRNRWMISSNSDAPTSRIRLASWFRRHESWLWTRRQIKPKQLLAVNHSLGSTQSLQLEEIRCICSEGYSRSAIVIFLLMRCGLLMYARGTNGYASGDEPCIDKFGEERFMMMTTACINDLVQEEGDDDEEKKSRKVNKMWKQNQRRRTNDRIYERDE